MDKLQSPPPDSRKQIIIAQSAVRQTQIAPISLHERPCRLGKLASRGTYVAILSLKNVRQAVAQTAIRQPDIRRISSHTAHGICYHSIFQLIATGFRAKPDTLPLTRHKIKRNVAQHIVYSRTAHIDRLAGSTLAYQPAVNLHHRLIVKKQRRSGSQSQRSALSHMQPPVDDPRTVGAPRLIARHLIILHPVRVNRRSLQHDRLGHPIGRESQCRLPVNRRIRPSCRNIRRHKHIYRIIRTDLYSREPTPRLTVNIQHKRRIAILKTDIRNRDHLIMAVIHHQLHCRSHLLRKPVAEIQRISAELRLISRRCSNIILYATRRQHSHNHSQRHHHKYPYRQTFKNHSLII